ncbi:MAG TPA: glycosyltransferase family 9 protein, partial [Terracidiphilus sp.]|nr:glycosyltransferase family 9 protein [Terracidiphilus sp.]
MEKLQLVVIPSEARDLLFAEDEGESKFLARSKSERDSEWHLRQFFSGNGDHGTVIAEFAESFRQQVGSSMKIMIRATNWVGDAILALPAIRAVRHKFPEAHISIVARPYVAEIYRDQSICDELIAYDPKGTHCGWSSRAVLAAELRERKLDVALLLQNAFDAAWLAWRAGIPERIGYARDGRRLLLTKAIAVPKSGEIPAHEKFYYLELLRRAGWIDRLQDDAHIALHVPEAR